MLLYMIDLVLPKLNLATERHQPQMERQSTTRLAYAIAKRRCRKNLKKAKELLHIKKTTCGAGEVAQWLKALVALPKDLG